MLINKHNTNVKAFKKWYRRISRDADFTIEEGGRGFEDGNVDYAWLAFMAGVRAANRRTKIKSDEDQPKSCQESMIDLLIEAEVQIDVLNLNDFDLESERRALKHRIIAEISKLRTTLALSANDEYNKCTSCDGLGYTNEQAFDDDIPVACPDCGGSGKRSHQIIKTEGKQS